MDSLTALSVKLATVFVSNSPPSLNPLSILTRLESHLVNYEIDRHVSKTLSVLHDMKASEPVADFGNFSNLILKSNFMSVFFESYPSKHVLQRLRTEAACDA